MSDGRKRTDEAGRGAESYASPACAAAGMDDAYAGFMTREEVLAFLNLMLESERAGARVLTVLPRQASKPDLAAGLAAVGRDEARYCAMLTRHIERLSGEPSRTTGPFFDKVMALPDLDAQLTLLNRGQGWVAKKIREALPKIRDDALHADLKEMLETHERNIARCEELAG